MAKENDIYYGDLMLLKRRVNEWAASHPKNKLFQLTKIGVLLAGFGAMILAYMVNPAAAQEQRVSLFTCTIFFAFVAMITVARKITSTLQPPFNKLYNVRFEASDEGILCYYQQKMVEYNYYIKDKNIKEWIIDSDVNCMYIRGKAELTKATKEGPERVGSVEAFYMLIPFDQFDLDDLVEPYGNLVQYQNGTMRDRIAAAGVTKPVVDEVKPYSKAKKLNK
ncbi:MAG: hypothetical protein KBS68_03215 [Clostridiales bacterium]|nr:hypothetical protein [Candidatus Crickella merdequi]